MPGPFRSQPLEFIDFVSLVRARGAGNFCLRGSSCPVAESSLGSRSADGSRPDRSEHGADETRMGPQGWSSQGVQTPAAAGVRMRIP